jgi:hypothetical protein
MRQSILHYALCRIEIAISFRKERNMSLADTVGEVVNGLIEKVSGDTETICRDAEKSNPSDWKAAQIAKAMSVGAGAAAIPVAGYLTLPADLAATLRIMHRAATGICYLRLGKASDETFAGVLAVWSGAVTLDADFAKQVTAKALAIGGSTIGGGVGLNMVIEAFRLSAGVIASKKLGPKIGQKVANKIAGKLGAKGATRWIPFVSAAVGAGTNWWLINRICNAADEYCGFIDGLEAAYA